MEKQGCCMTQKKSAKTELKQKKKEIEDKTFGLKNKNKSAKVAKHIKSLEKNILQNIDVKKEKEKVSEKKKKDEFSDLFKIVEDVQKVPPGVDPKTVLCINFKKGNCSRGKECKFSHDVATERRQAKIDVHIDPRSDMLQNESKFRKTCLSFLEAVERKQYGWFWICPNGGDACPYLHALPEDYVFRAEESTKTEEELTLEEYIEREREKLEHKKQTPVTEETFKAWKEKTQNKKEVASRRKKLTGKDLFQATPEMFKDDVFEEGLDVDYKRREWKENAVDKSLFEDLENIVISE